MHKHHHHLPRGKSKETKMLQHMIKEVWESNLEEEFYKIRNLVDRYNHIAMDTEFPGVVARPIGNFTGVDEYQYHTIRCNVDLLNIIQLGITLSDAKGNLPRETCTWQFNFRFSRHSEMFAQDSIDLLDRSGIDFKILEEKGIDRGHFGELLVTSGLVMNPDVKWISFHSGYDFGYLSKVILQAPLSNTSGDFFAYCKVLFPRIYDIKAMIKGMSQLKGGLNDLANELDVKRIGPQHQAGSDSLLTLMVFFKLCEVYFNGLITHEHIEGKLYGLNSVPSTLLDTF